MIEIERKVLGIDVPELIQVVQGLPFSTKKTFEGRILISYFDFPDGRIRAKKDLLRVREFLPDGSDAHTYGEPCVEIVYKTYGGITDGSKVFDECEIALPKSGVRMTGRTVGETWKTFLEKLGLSRVVYYEKHRTHYNCGDFKLEIDAHPKIPAFVEIEAQSGAEIDRAITLLGLENFEQTPETISELLARKYAPLTLGDLVF